MIGKSGIETTFEALLRKKWKEPFGDGFKRKNNKNRRSRRKPNGQ